MHALHALLVVVVFFAGFAMIVKHMSANDKHAKSLCTTIRIEMSRCLAAVAAAGKITFAGSQLLIALLICCAGDMS